MFFLLLALCIFSVAKARFTVGLFFIVMFFASSKSHAVLFYPVLKNIYIIKWISIWYKAILITFFPTNLIADIASYSDIGLTNIWGKNSLFLETSLSVMLSPHYLRSIRYKSDIMATNGAAPDVHTHDHGNSMLLLHLFGFKMPWQKND